VRRKRRGEEGRLRRGEGRRGRKVKGIGKEKIAGMGERGPVCLAKGEEETVIWGRRGEGRGRTPRDRVVEAVVIRPRERRAVPV